MGGVEAAAPPALQSGFHCSLICEDGGLSDTADQVGTQVALGVQHFERVPSR